MDSGQNGHPEKNKNTSDGGGLQLRWRDSPRRTVRQQRQQKRTVLGYSHRVSPQATILEHHQQQQQQQQDRQQQQVPQSNSLPFTFSSKEGMTPQGLKTPNKSNQNTANRSSNKRGLHNSHRKQKLHRITPRTVEITPSPLANTHDLYHPGSIGYQHRGNGVVLDLTSLFWKESDNNETTPAAAAVPTAPSPTETATTAMSTKSHNPSQPLQPHRGFSSASLSLPHQDHDADADVDADSLQGGWDTRSQTTQEALITERECQALTQWLNFVLVGGESQTQEEEESAGKEVAWIEQSGSNDINNTTMEETARSITHRHGKAATTTLARARYATTPPRTRTVTTTSTTHPSSSTIPQQQSRQRRHNSFQYSQTYHHAQQQAHHWFLHAPLWKDLRVRIKQEITTGKLQLRPDRNLYANVACRELLLELFLQYRPVWLTLALEVVLQETLVKPNSDNNPLPSNTQLKQVITNRVLHDAALLNKYNQGRGSRVPSGHFEEQYQGELRPLVLYRLLVLIFFLDRAAGAGKFRATLGNLWTTSSSVKSTKDVLTRFCRDFLSKEGDVIKHLARVKLHCLHEQHALQELDFTVRNFAVDLRDGVRLCRVVEVLWLQPEKYPLLHQLRIPAISRLQKIHNVNVALQALQELHIGLPRDMQAHHIVDGQRRMVLRFVWTVVLMHCFENSQLLTPAQLQMEIKTLQKAHSRNRQEYLKRQSSLLLLEQETDAIENVAAMSDDDGELYASIKKKKQMPQTTSRISPSKSSSFDGNESCNSDILLEALPVVQQWKGLLWQWCQQVCILVEDRNCISARALSNTDKADFTIADLTNGKALCCLIHYYHPSLLPLKELRLNSTFIDEPPRNIHTSTISKSFHHTRTQMLNPKVTPDYYIRLAHRRLSDLGGIPPMMLLPLSSEKEERGKLFAPLAEEKSMIVFLYQVCARLLESRYQVQALVKIQLWFRYRLWVTLWKAKRAAASKVWTLWKQYKKYYYQNRWGKYGTSVQVIEVFVFNNFNKLQLLREERLKQEAQKLSAVSIQTQARGLLGRKFYFSLVERRDAAVQIQSRYRQFREFSAFQQLRLRVLPSVVVLQRHWRGFIQRRIYGRLIDAVIRFQALARGAISVRTCLLQSWLSASTTIQRIWRGFWVQLHYQMDLLDVVAFQCFVRQQQAIKVSRQRKKCVGVLQRAGRCFLARKALAWRRRQRGASILIQKTLRGYLGVRKAAKARAMLMLANAIFVVQRSWRRFVFIRERHIAATRIQAQYRSSLASCKYANIRASAIVGQTKWRQHSNQAKYQCTLKDIILIQCWLRRWFYGRVQLDIRKKALQRLHNRARIWLARQAMEAMRQYRILVVQQAVICQALIRRNICVKEWKKTRQAVSRLQGKWYSYRCLRDSKRKRELTAALTRCSPFFWRNKKRSFKVIPHTRHLVALVKQAYIRCGQKRLFSSNATTDVPLYYGCRQNLFHHRRHVKSLRKKRVAACVLETLPRRQVALKDLKLINQAATAFQVKWLYGHDKGAGDVTCVPKELPKGSILQRRLNFRTKRAARASLQFFLEHFVGSFERTSRIVKHRRLAKFEASIYVLRTQMRFHRRLDQMLTLERLFVLARRNGKFPVSKRSTKDEIVTHALKSIPIQQYAKTVWGVQMLQSRYRSRLVRRKATACLNYAATQIQKTWQCYNTSVHFIFLVVSAIKLQNWVRMHLTKKATAEILRKTKEFAANKKHYMATVKIQSLLRMELAKREHKIREEWRHCLPAICKIQSFFRMVLAKNIKSSLFNERARTLGANELQHSGRIVLADKIKSQLLGKAQAVPSVIRLQAYIRMVIAKNYVAKASASIKIQSFFRMVNAAKFSSEMLQRKRRERQFELKRSKATFILQVAARNFLAQLPRRKLVRRLSVSQGMVRGFLTRKQSNSDVRNSVFLIKEAALRSEQDPAMRLGNRMSRALTLLKTSQSLTEIMNIVCTLELATRFSKECCEEFVGAYAPEILVELIPTCNRSLPHVELLYYTLRTLSNVSRHDNLESAIATVKGAETFLYLIRMYTDEDAIFCSAVKLLEFCAIRSKEADALLNIPSSRRRLISLYEHWERKLSQTSKKGKCAWDDRTPSFIVTRSKAKTDMLILGISYDLNYGVAVFRRLLSLPAAGPS